MDITLQFNGGAELLFGKIKEHKIQLDATETWTMKKLLVWIKDNLLKERPELFLQGETVRPGILVLVNNADWELLGQTDYQLQNRDEIVFISTLHGDGKLIAVTSTANLDCSSELE